MTNSGQPDPVKDVQCDEIWALLMHRGMLFLLDEADLDTGFKVAIDQQEKARKDITEPSPPPTSAK